MPLFYSPKSRSFKISNYPQRWVILNKGIILNYKNRLICIGLLDIFRIGYFGLKFDLMDQTSKKGPVRTYFQWNIYRLIFCSRYTIFVTDLNQTKNQLIFVSKQHNVVRVYYHLAPIPSPFQPQMAFFFWMQHSDDGTLTFFTTNIIAGVRE